MRISEPGMSHLADVEEELYDRARCHSHRLSVNCSSDLRHSSEFELAAGFWPARHTAQNTISALELLAVLS
jgi:hypothetical protein